MTRLVICEPPATDAPFALQLAVADDDARVAVTRCPKTERLRFPTDADDWLSDPEAFVEALRADAVKTPGTVAAACEALWDPPDGGNGPVSASVLVTPRTVALTAVA